jgi:hypothetical protein
MRFLNKDHQWKIGQLIVGALIRFIACLAAFGAAGFFWLQHDLEEKIVQPLLERELNRVLEGFRSEYLAGGVFIKQMQGLMLESSISCMETCVRWPASSKRWRAARMPRNPAFPTSSSATTGAS